MLLELAPMEGITTTAFRRLHHALFPGVDRYYTPFWSPTQDHRMTARDKRELLPEQNEGLCVIPQLLTKSAADFIWAAQTLCDLGYEEVNLNAGCPSGTVTAKGKGSGLLADPDHYRQFLDEIFAKSACRISIKTRLGLRDPEEFEELLAVYNDYPVACLTVHPRVRNDFYKVSVRMDWFEYALQNSKNPVSFNGGVLTVADLQRLEARYPDMQAIMVGQALVADPALGRKWKGGSGAAADELQAFHDQLYETCAVLFESRPNAVRRMKELWVYGKTMFRDGEKLKKQIFKSKTPADYEAAAAAVFRGLELLPETNGGW